MAPSAQQPRPCGDAHPHPPRTEPVAARAPDMPNPPRGEQARPRVRGGVPAQPRQGPMRTIAFLRSPPISPDLLLPLYPPSFPVAAAAAAGAGSSSLHLGHVLPGRFQQSPPPPPPRALPQPPLQAVQGAIARGTGIGNVNPQIIRPPDEATVAWQQWAEHVRCRGDSRHVWPLPNQCDDPRCRCSSGDGCSYCRDALEWNRQLSQWERHQQPQGQGQVQVQGRGRERERDERPQQRRGQRRGPPPPPPPHPAPPPEQAQAQARGLAEARALLVEAQARVQAREQAQAQAQAQVRAQPRALLEQARARAQRQRRGQAQGQAQEQAQPPEPAPE